MKKFLIATSFLLSLNSNAQLDNKILQKPVKKTNNDRIVNINQSVYSAYNFSNIKTCIDVPSPMSPLPPRAASNSYSHFRIDANGNISPYAYQRQPLVAITDKMWEPGETLRFGFDITGGNLNLLEKVKYYAKEWEKYANIKLEFVPSIFNATIKIGFKPGGSYSLIGRDALNAAPGTITMNFGWLATTTDESMARRVILHEFGHALGFIHEHQSPGGNIPWDKEKTYAFYAQPPDNWTKAEIDYNVFTKYSTSVTNYSRYDPLSIMHYPIPAELTTTGIGVPFNIDFSATDKQYVSLVYPFPPNPPNAYGILKTGDDCDEVAFSVEYGSVPLDKIVISIELGQQATKKVTWWKQIGIPLTNNTESLLWVQNHSLIASENKTVASVEIPIKEIAINKGISFWKAKILGVHTPLNYKWNVLPAIRGGCKIKLSWNKDNCL